jgi:hypothetical protein
LAVRVSKELVAAEGDYTRIKADLKAIRAFAKGEVRRLEPDWKKSGLEPATEPPAWAQARCLRKG